MKNLYIKFLMWLTRRRITSLGSVETLLEALKNVPDVPEAMWGLLYWRKYSLENKIDHILNYLEQ